MRRVLILASAVLIAPPALGAPMSELDRKAAYCANLLSKQRDLMVEDGQTAGLPGLDARSGRLAAYLAARAPAVGAGALTEAGQRQTMENFFDLGRRAAEAGCLKPGKAPDQACLARVLKESGIAEQRASCGELSWLPAGEGP